MSPAAPGGEGARRAGEWDGDGKCAEGVVRDSCLAAARELAIRAAVKLEELRRVPLAKERKADRSWVTNADHESDRILREGLHKAFPDHAILTEESGLEGSPGAPYVWLVDPLDGTKAYVHDRPGYSVMIGLLLEGRPCLGVVVDPVTGDVYEAVRGMGAFRRHNGVSEPLRVSSRRIWSDMPVITSTGFPENLKSALIKEFPGPWLPPVNSVGIKVGYLARQAADLYLNHHGVHYWDTAAPQIILEEAGGRLTFLDGSPLEYRVGGSHRHPAPTLASNGPRHAEAVAVVSRLMRPA